jgi:hypothetical protein
MNFYPNADGPTVFPKVLIIPLTAQAQERRGFDGH